MMTEVVAALIWEGERFLICQRPAHKARGLLWEFVGGKVEPGETPEQALARECREELDVTVSVGEPFMDVVHAYPDLTVHLTLFHAALAGGDHDYFTHLQPPFPLSRSNWFSALTRRLIFFDHNIIITDPRNLRRPISIFTAIRRPRDMAGNAHLRRRKAKRCDRGVLIASSASMHDAAQPAHNQNMPASHDFRTGVDVAQHDHIAIKIYVLTGTQTFFI